jgi:hypothetical protein
VGVPALSFEVKFIHVLITDVLTSSCLFLWDIEYTICLFSTSSWIHGNAHIAGDAVLCGEGSWNIKWIKPVVIMLPFWLRFVQCVWIAITKSDLKSIANAFKYLSAIFVVATSAAGHWDTDSHKTFWFWAWIVALIVKTCFCFYWDIVNDWGLVKLSFPNGLRSMKLTYRDTQYYSKHFYRGAAIFDFFGRISWALAISPRFCDSACRLVFGLVEIIRRGLWIVIRVEWQAIAHPPASPALTMNTEREGTVVGPPTKFIDREDGSIMEVDL